VDLPELPEHLQSRVTRGTNGDEWRPLSLDEVRKVHIQKVLELCQGNRLRAAQVLGIGRISLYRYLKHDAEDAGEAAIGVQQASRLTVDGKI